MSALVVDLQLPAAPIKEGEVVSISEFAKGAGLAALSRLGALARDLAKNFVDSADRAPAVYRRAYPAGVRTGGGGPVPQ